MPITQTVIRAQESTSNVDSSRAIRDVDSRLAYLDPDSAPFTAVLMRAGSKDAENTKFEWMEKELSARWDAINNGGGYASGATSIVVDSGKFFSVGDVVNVVRTGEKILVTAVATNTLTVVRGIGTTVAAALLDNDDLQIIGNSYQEGSTSGSPKSVSEAFLYNYTQIIRTPFGATRSEQSVSNYTGPPRTRLRMEKGVEHRIDIERSLLFGERALSTTGGDSTDNPRRYMGGVDFFLEGLSTTAKIKDFAGLVTEPEIEDWLQDVFNVTGAGDQRTLLASPLWCSIFDQIAMGRIQVVDRAETYGVTVRRFITSHGELNIVKDRLLENSPVPAGTVGGPFGFAGYAFALDFNRLTYRPLQGGGATKLHTDIQAPDYDGWKDEYLTECGLQLMLAKVHGVGKGATG